jgi:hypothetical protein
MLLKQLKITPIMEGELCAVQRKLVSLQMTSEIQKFAIFLYTDFRSIDEQGQTISWNCIILTL